MWEFDTGDGNTYPFERVNGFEHKIFAPRDKVRACIEEGERDRKGKNKLSDVSV